MNSKMDCVMCGYEAEWIAAETNEALCEKCTKTNEEIKIRDYPHKVFKFRPEKI